MTDNKVNYLKTGIDDLLGSYRNKRSGKHWIVFDSFVKHGYDGQGKQTFFVLYDKQNPTNVKQIPMTELRNRYEKI